MKAVFQHKPDSPYDDEPGQRYHFPKQYLRRVEQTKGDWVVFLEPRKLSGKADGAFAYMSIARVVDIYADKQKPNHYYAQLADALDLGQTVPVKHPNGIIEARLRNDDGSLKPGGQMQSAVRLISDDEFDLIMRYGLIEGQENAAQQGFGESQQATFDLEIPDSQSRERILTERTLRDRNFRKKVLAAYDNRCALTGLRLVNGGGAAEVEAAHIKSVADGGPDLLQNGIAFSKTVHWMFDRMMITFEDDYSLRRMPNLGPDGQRFIGNYNELQLPARKQDWPNITFIKFHREKSQSYARRQSIPQTSYI
jgi:putative restriction endonuclease